MLRRNKHSEQNYLRKELDTRRVRMRRMDSHHRILNPPNAQAKNKVRKCRRRSGRPVCRGQIMSKAPEFIEPSRFFFLDQATLMLDTRSETKYVAVQIPFEKNSRAPRRQLSCGSCDFVGNACLSASCLCSRVFGHASWLSSTIFGDLPAGIGG